jgi:CPW-WPC domain-containing protein
VGLISVTFMSCSILDQERDFDSRNVSTTACHTMLAVRAFAFVLGCSAFADDASSAIADIGEVLGQHVVNDLPVSQSMVTASNIMKAMSRLPAPASPFIESKLDPSHDAVVGTCDPDYTVDCPQHFVSIGSIFGGSASYCAADSTYAGPCDSDVFNFATYSKQAKARWSSMCLASWPCMECERDFQSPCPRDWLRAAGAQKCTPPSYYTGPCGGTVDFAFYNRAMLSEWSSRCGAFWECA